VSVSLEETLPERQGSLLRRLRKIMGLRGRPKEIQEVLDESEEQGLIDHDEGDMIEGIFDLKQTVAREIMIPRTYIVGVSQDSTKEHILSTIIESGHSRIPVYNENIDHIVGILNAKDLLPLWLDGESEFNIRPILREPFFVPETKRINDLLNELRTKKSHLAVIVDEYGGTAGIVTIEDIIEEIIGEIRDEHDMEEELFIPQEDGSVFVNAWANLDDFEENFDVTLPREGYDTLGGFIIHLLGKVPRKGEEIEYGRLRIKVLAGDQKKITRVSVTKLGLEPEADITSSHPETNP
jgi:CBS domain containing-hemolysin-like protein